MMIHNHGAAVARRVRTYEPNTRARRSGGRSGDNSGGCGSAARVAPVTTQGPHTAVMGVRAIA